MVFTPVPTRGGNFLSVTRNEYILRIMRILNCIYRTFSNVYTIEYFQIFANLFTIILQKVRYVR